MRFGMRTALAVFVVLATHIGGFVLIFIVPYLKFRWDNSGVRLSFAKEALITVSDFMREWCLIVLSLIFIAALLFVFLPLIFKQRIEPLPRLDKE